MRLAEQGAKTRGSTAEATTEEECSDGHRAEGTHDAMMDAFHANVVLHFFFYFLQSAQFALLGCLDYSHSGVGYFNNWSVCSYIISNNPPAAMVHHLAEKRRR